MRWGKGGISSSSSSDIEAPPADDNLRFVLAHPCSSSTASSPHPLHNNKTPTSSYFSNNGILWCRAINNMPHKDHSLSSLSSTNPTKTTTTTTTSSSSCNRTPPIQASVSPEIMSSATAAAPTSITTPCCYGAPHVISGVSVTVTDKRRRRPLGLLVVGLGQPPNPLVPFHATDYDDDDDDHQGISLKDAASGASPSPPLQASMHWFLSPSREAVVDDDRGGPTTEHDDDDDGYHFSHSSPPSPPSSGGSTHTTLTPHLCAYSGSGHTIVSATTSGGVTTPGWKHTSRVLPLLDKDDTAFPRLDGPRSPLSVDSVGSANVMQTPQSDSTYDYRIATTCVGDDDTRAKLIFEPELDQVNEHLRGAALSPKTHVSLWNPAGSSFQLDLSTPPPDPVNNISTLQKISDPHASWSTGKSSVEIARQSLTGISWRDRLESTIFEMDRFDCCRCFSNEEDESKGFNNCSKSQFSPQLNSAFDQILADNVGSYEATDGECLHVCRKKEKLPPQAHHSCAESISTDGGGLICSDDSDWTSCYKNHLFQG